MTVTSFLDKISETKPAHYTGRITEVAFGHIYSNGPLGRIGDLCEIENVATTLDQESHYAEIVGINSDKVVLVSYQNHPNLRPGLKVTLQNKRTSAQVGDSLGGRMISSLIEAIDGKGDIYGLLPAPLQGRVPKPLDRISVSEILPTGVKAIDAVMPITVGQRIGVFAASGVGKTTLITQLAQQADCDRCVICLVGERGREVEQIWNALIDSEKEIDNVSVVVATSDQSAALRVRAVDQAIAMAEYWRDQGEHVLLVVDSVTRYAMAQRELGLAAGASPTLRSYPTNVFESLPKIVERCGALKKGGSITGIFSVLSETDDMDDPIVEAMKSYLDGHILLSREKAESGHYPAIDILSSISRLSKEVMSSEQTLFAKRLISNLSVYQKSKTLIESGIYKKGNVEIDKSIELNPKITNFLQQSYKEKVPLEQAMEQMFALFGESAQ